MVLLAALLAFPAAGQDYDGHFSQARDAVYNQRMDPQEVVSLLDSSRQTIHAISTEQQRLYWLARLEALQGYMELHTTENMESAETHYRNSQDMILQALELGEFSEGYRLLSQTVSNLCLIKGTAFILANGLDVERYARKALELDPHNGKAKILLASSKIYPPRIFGGDPQQGIAIMEQALQAPDLDNADRFDILSGIGFAYQKLKDYRTARLYLKRSLEIFPDNRFANEKLKELSS